MDQRARRKKYVPEFPYEDTEDSIRIRHLAKLIRNIAERNTGLKMWTVTIAI